MYSNEIEIYEDLIVWLKDRLTGDFQKAKKITVLDTHDKDLSSFIIKLNYQNFFLISLLIKSDKTLLVLLSMRIK